MHLKYLLTCALIAIAAPSIALAQPEPERDSTSVWLTEGAGFCETDALFEQLARAIVDDDEHALAWLIDNGCGVANADWPATVLDSRAYSARIRVYVEGTGSVEVFTLRAHLKPRKGGKET